MNVCKIVEDWLRQHGYDGLVGEDCGCEIDDLMPCAPDDRLYDCVPGRKVPCDGCKRLNEEEQFCESRHRGEGWCMRVADEDVRDGLSSTKTPTSEGGKGNP